MKTKIIILVMIIALVLMTNCSFGYSNEYFEIEPIANYQTDEQGNTSQKIYMFQEDLINGGDNFNVVVVPYNGKTRSNLYTDEMKDALAQNIQKEMKEQANAQIEIVNKEISTVGSDSYQAILLQWYSPDLELYQKQYTLASDQYVYTITLTSKDASYFEKQEVQTMLNSFVVKDTMNEPNQTMNYAMIALMVVAVVGIAIGIMISRKKKEEKKEE